MGILYLENNLVPGAFTSERLEVLKVLSAQAAISITNARLYASLEENNVNLERRVAERTRELEERNAQILRTQKQMVMQEKMAQMGILTAGVAHELKNPLNFVINFAEICGERMGEFDTSGEGKHLSEDGREILDEIRDSLQVIRRHGTRANDIVSSMMDLARGAKGERTMANLNRLVTEFSALACRSAKSRSGIGNVVIGEHLDSTIGEISMVSQDMSRVVINLVTNAVEALAAKMKRAPSDFVPTVEVTTQNLGDAVELRVKDNGPGIAEQDLPKVWAPFFTTKPTGTGNVGLGLGICYDIVHQQHGGEIRVETTVGQGTEFIVKLPRQ
jgi:signal transduction histidine kinase